MLNPLPEDFKRWATILGLSGHGGDLNTQA